LAPVQDLEQPTKNKKIAKKADQEQTDPTYQYWKQILVKKSRKSFS